MRRYSQNNASLMDIEPMLAVRDVARLLHVHSNTVRRWSDQGILRAYCINQRGDRRYRKDDIFRFLLQLEAHKGNVHKVRI